MNDNSGHGHVWERPDGVKARCGGPGICTKCSRDLAAVTKGQTYVTKPEPKVIGFFERVIRAFPEHVDQESMFWTIRDGVIQIWVDCSDTFAWGCADTEELTPDNIGDYEEAVKFVKGLTTPDDPNPLGHDEFCASTLFCARIRKQTPMPQFMTLIKSKKLVQALENCSMS